MSYLLVFLLVTSPTPRVPLKGITPMIISEQRAGSVLPNGAQFYSQGTCGQWARRAIGNAVRKGIIDPKAVVNYTFTCESST